MNKNNPFSIALLSHYSFTYSPPPQLGIYHVVGRCCIPCWYQSVSCVISHHTTTFLHPEAVSKHLAANIFSDASKGR